VLKKEIEMALKAKSPEIKEKRLKMLVYGPAGVGKTTASIQFPNSYIIDTEKGTDFYAETINKVKSAVLQTLNVDEVKEELKALATEKHHYRTLIIDPVTQLYNNVQEKYTRIFEKYAKSEKDQEVGDFGMRYWGKVKGDFKGLQRLILALDMNVIVTSHQKDVYGAGFSKIGTTFDSMKGDDYLFDLVFQVERKNGDLMAKTIKERAEIGKQKFPADFIWSYDNFCKFYGKEIIEKEATPIIMATDEQVARANKLIEVVKVDEGTVNKWLEKADVDNFSEMTGEQITKVIEYLEKKVASLVDKQETELQASLKKEKK
jgi:GTPase SAR1 family protein